MTWRVAKHIGRAQIKHTRNFSIKNFGALRPPPPPKFLCLGFFLCFEEEKGGPKHKEIVGVGGPLGGGSRRGGSGKILYVYAFFRGLSWGRKTYRTTHLPENSGALEKERLVWSSVFLQGAKSSDTRGGWKTCRTMGGPNPLFGRAVIREVFLPLLFVHPPPWRPLT